MTRDRCLMTEGLWMPKIVDRDAMQTAILEAAREDLRGKGLSFFDDRRSCRGRRVG